ncbi:MAG: DUF4443 domain-containing protein [Nitrososphaeraceae archaeon]
MHSKETVIPKSSITVGKFNYVVLVKNIANSIRSGIEQRDVAIKSGAMGATTLLLLIILNINSYMFTYLYMNICYINFIFYFKTFSF